MTRRPAITALKSRETVFYDRTLGLGGRGALNFAAHLNDFAANSKEGFTQARRWLAERFYRPGESGWQLNNCDPAA